MLHVLHLNLACSLRERISETTEDSRSQEVSHASFEV